jgi:hypothetical protein
LPEDVRGWVPEKALSRWVPQNNRVFVDDEECFMHIAEEPTKAEIIGEDWFDRRDAHGVAASYSKVSCRLKYARPA